MASYKIQWKKSAVKELKQANKSRIQEILTKVELLSCNPRPTGTKKLKGSDFTYRIRVGDYRVIYDIFEKTITIHIIKIGHRKNVYK